ncbi:SDR family oxidoreductase [SAR202 cluster bacterium AD-802-E10_MRT_200m]|nr:SDR family oxidoreductase [SAR202 cluster bacterium AD-802-E10_MRT_200m]
MELQDKKVVVTGGSRGIGFEICKIFLEHGAEVLAVSRNSDNLRIASGLLPGLITFQADLTLNTDNERLANWVLGHWARLDILVNNAGVSPEGGRELTVQPDTIFEETIQVNLFGPYLCTKRLLPFLQKAKWPRIVNIGSSVGIMSSDLTGAYSISKAALHALSVAFANELRGKVSVNTLCPGWVRTDMAPDAPGDPRTSAESTLWLVTQPWEFTGKIIRGRVPV